MASTNVVTAMNGNDRTTVKAVYKFKASNNDELSFKKGDIITVTQREDGGWWEGTSRETGKTGWFPSNYVTEVKETSPTGADVLSTTPLAGIDATTAAELLARQIENRQQVIRDLIEKEKEFVSELHNLQTTYLEPLLRTELMTISEYRQLAGNLDELIEVHRGLAAALDEEAPPKKAPREQRVGRVLLAHGSNVKGAHLSYWANHPKAVCILERHRSALDAFMESQGATKPGLMTLTTGLSKPFRQLERYASVSQELEQHQEDDHIDRGDAQRSISFYKNVAAECAKHKKQKELELEVLTGTIRGWEGEELTTLGDIIHMGSVAVGTDHKDRYFVLFPTNLLILSVSARMSAFIYEGKLPLSGIAVNRLEDSETIKNSFEITGPMIDRIVVVNQTRTEALRWVEILRQQIKCARQTSALSTTSPQQQQQPPLPPHKLVPSSPNIQKKQQPTSAVGKSCWKMSCLRPAPPTRSYLAQPDAGNKRNSANVKKKVDPETTYEEDMQILRVIEAYYSLSSAKQRQTLPTSSLVEMNYHHISPRAPVREDSHCRLLENSCDELSEEDEEIELFVEEMPGGAPATLIQRKVSKFGTSSSSPQNRAETVWRQSEVTTVDDSDDSIHCPSCSLEDDDDEEDDVVVSRRDSVTLGAGCLPCTPKSKRFQKTPSNSAHSNSSSAHRCICKKHKKCPAGRKQCTSNWCCGVVASTVKRTAKKL